MVGLLTLPTGGLGHTDIEVWNWKTGEKVAVLSGSGIESFVFLNEQFMLCSMSRPVPSNDTSIYHPNGTPGNRYMYSSGYGSDGYGSEGYASDGGSYIYPTRNDSPSEHTVLSLTAVDFSRKREDGGPIDTTREPTLLLPPLDIQTAIEGARITIHTDPRPTPADTARPFTTNLADRLLVIAINPDSVEPEASFAVFIRESKILEIVKEMHVDGTLELLWDAWGPAHTRAMNIYLPDSYDGYVHGLKAVVPVPDFEQQGPVGKKGMQLLDFDMRGLNRNLGQDNGTAGRGMSCVFAPTEVDPDQAMFESELVTTLPYRVREFEITVEQGNALAMVTVMFAEDGFLVTVSFV